MSILIINASPRPNGNSAYIANELAKNYDNAEVINLRELDLKPCTACRACKATGNLCVIKDSMVEVYPKLLNADKIVFISPNIMGFLSSLGKIFTDRFYCLKTADKKTKFDEDKKAIFLFIQGSPNRERGDVASHWAKKFFEGYGLKTFTMVVPNCSADNTETAQMKLDEIKMNISMF